MREYRSQRCGAAGARPAVGAWLTAGARLATGAWLAAGAGLAAAAVACNASDFVTRPPAPVPVRAAGEMPASPSTRAAAGITRTCGAAAAGICTEPMSTRPSLRLTSTTASLAGGN